MGPGQDPLLDVGHLRLLSSLADVRTLQEAADMLHYTPAAVSARLARVEAQLGLRVAQRGAGGIVLTDAGRRLSRRSRRLLDLHDAALAAAATAPVEGRDLVRVSIFPAARDHLLVPAVRAARARRPFRLRMRISDTVEAIREVREGQSDLAVVYDFAARRAETAGLDVRWLLDEQIVTILPHDHVAADRRRLSLGHLAGDAFIGAPMRSFAAPVFAGCCSTAGFEPRVIGTTPRDRGVIDLVGAGLGVAQVAALGFGGRMRDVTVRYTTERPQRRLLLVRPPGSPGACVDALCAALVEQAGIARERAPVVPLSR